jgi:hypothetical protein
MKTRGRAAGRETRTRVSIKIQIKYLDRATFERTDWLRHVGRETRALRKRSTHWLSVDWCEVRSNFKRPGAAAGDETVSHTLRLALSAVVIVLFIHCCFNNIT